MHNRGGFTIIETMIVLAVTGVMFVSIVISLGQRQSRIEFSQGIREIESIIRDVLNDVDGGFYPTVPGLRCTAAPTAANPPPVLDYDGTAPDTTGKNSDCVFAGKVMLMGDSVDKSNITVFTMAGRRLRYVGTEPNEVSTFAQLKPVVVDSRNTDNVNTSNPGIANINAMTDTKFLPNGITLVDASGNASARAIGIFYRNFQVINSAGQQVSGATTTSLARVASGTLASMTIPNVISAADSLGGGAFVGAAQTVVLCFRSAGTDQTAVIRMSPGIQGSLRVEMFNTVASIASEPCL